MSQAVTNSPLGLLGLQPSSKVCGPRRAEYTNAPSHSWPQQAQSRQDSRVPSMGASQNQQILQRGKGLGRAWRIPAALLLPEEPGAPALRAAPQIPAVADAPRNTDPSVHPPRAQQWNLFRATHDQQGCCSGEQRLRLQRGLGQD